jgi:pimeloyl-ACP methyl ester carboxylesterase
MHDSLGCVELWRKFPALLCPASGRKVIAYDRLGYGRSDMRLEPLSMSFMHEESEVFLPNVVKKFQLQKFIVFGHSAGGQRAAICASKFKDACVGAIIESSPSSGQSSSTNPTTSFSSSHG